MRDPQAERQRQQEVQQTLIGFALQPPDDRDQYEEADVEHNWNADQKGGQQDRQRRLLLTERLHYPPGDEFRRSGGLEHAAKHRAQSKQQQDFAQNIRDSFVNRIDDLRGGHPGRQAQAQTYDQERDERMDVVADDEHQERDQRRRCTLSVPRVT